MCDVVLKDGGTWRVEIHCSNRHSDPLYQEDACHPGLVFLCFWRRFPSHCQWAAVVVSGRYILLFKSIIPGSLHTISPQVDL